MTLRVLWCRLGWHAWADRHVSGLRLEHGRPVASVTRTCRRCPVVRHEQHTRVPRRWRAGVS